MTLAVFTRRALPYLRRLDSRERQLKQINIANIAVNNHARKRKRYLILSVFPQGFPFHPLHTASRRRRATTRAQSFNARQ
mmetsp:Transcript_17882/g.30219  ORF Transcript_17882/g.30219 Transcript_17882/m.30219 type:complete len:80 (-) Transcript_17882:27-266(-)